MELSVRDIFSRLLPPWLHRQKQDIALLWRGGRDSSSTWVICLLPMPKSHLPQSSYLEFLASATSLGPSPKLERLQGHPSLRANTELLLYVWPDIRHCGGQKNGTYNVEKDTQPSKGWRSQKQRHLSLFTMGPQCSLYLPPGPKLLKLCIWGQGILCGGRLSCALQATE